MLTRTLLLLATLSTGAAPQPALRTADAVVRRLEPAAGQRMRAAFAGAGLKVGAQRLWLLAFKAERRVELWSAAPGGGRVLVRTWPILAASGGPGPKLREGDLQVPEGIYAIDLLNPASAYHLSLRLDYPNAFDRARAAEEGRRRLGGEIFIHGKAVSIGCIALGDPAIEELFWLAGTVGTRRFTVLALPHDLRTRAPPGLPTGPAWASDLYRSLRTELSAFGGR